MAVVSFKRALTLVLADKATLLVEDGDPVKSAENECFPRPAVILLRRYIRPPYQRRVTVTRRGVLRRDGHKCAYCGAYAGTVDHVTPRSRGGQDTWENLVACCVRCNNKKSNKTPAEMGWKLRFTPAPPTGPMWLVRGTENRHPKWATYLPEAA